MSTSQTLQSRMKTLLAWANLFNQLSTRERAIVSAGVLGVTWAFWFFLVNEHFSEFQVSLDREVQTVNTELVTSEIQRIELKQLAQLDPNQPVNEKITAVRNDLESMRNTLQSSLSQFIPPRAMTLVLRDLMADHKNLKLTLLNRLPARTLLPNDEAANLYMHPIRLELEGEYLDVLDYVASLENGDWQFNWQTFEYKTKGYPNGVATIEIETLSRDKNWLGL